MKKSQNSILALLIASVFLWGCASGHNVGVYGSGKLPNPSSRINNVDVMISVDKTKLKGRATCRKLLFFTLEAPSGIAYGYTLQTTEGIKGGDCVGGAVYDAIGNGQADYLIGAKYDVKSIEALCIFSACLYSDYQVEVSGYPGKVDSIKGSAEIDTSSVVSPSSEESGKSGILGLLPF